MGKSEWARVVIENEEIVQNFENMKENYKMFPVTMIRDLPREHENVILVGRVDTADKKGAASLVPHCILTTADGLCSASVKAFQRSSQLQS